MTRSQFFKHFELLADQKDAVAKMRELMLQLAIRGQIVEQIAADQKDGAWQNFLKSVDGKDGGDELPPFEIPKDWRWARLDDVADYSAARKVEPSELSDKAWVLDLEEIKKDTGRLLRVTTFREKQSSSNKAEFLPGDVLYGKLRPYLNKVLVAPQAGFCTTEIVPIRSRGMIVPTYLCLFLRSPHFVAYTNSKSYGMKMPRLGTEDAVQAWIAVPPPAEQRRIVAKVDELMALCDELEQRQQARQHASGLLQQSALHHLLAAREPQTFAAAWQRVRDHFHLLHDTPDAIPQLRQAILQLAVQGRLVPQNPKDEPAETLLREIAIKTKQSNAGNGSNETDWAESPHNPPFELPVSWRWARFDKIATIASNLVQPAKFASLPHVAPDNIEKGTGRLLPYRSVKEDDVRSANHRFFPGQLVYSKIRPNLSKAVVVDFEGLCSADMYPINPHINADYLLRYILSQTFLDMAVRNDTRVAMPKINQEELNRVLVAVPPLAEQKRIVARVEELLRWCDTLEAQLHQTRTLGAHLLDSTLHHLLAA